MQGKFEGAVEPPQLLDSMKGKTEAQLDGIAPRAKLPASKAAEPPSQPVRRPQPLLPKRPSSLYGELPQVSKA